MKKHLLTSILIITIPIWIVPIILLQIIVIGCEKFAEFYKTVYAKMWQEKKE